MGKVCKECKIEKDLSEFYISKLTSDGREGKCKECKQITQAIRLIRLRKNPKWVNKERQRGRDKYARLNYKEKFNASPDKLRTYMERYRKKFPEKYASHGATCRKPKHKDHELHHWSYNKEHYLDTIELTKTEHKKIHRFMIYDQERMMYRRSDTNELLDTKERHIKYFNSLKTIS